jgi:hypothetical protein
VAETLSDVTWSGNLYVAVGGHKIVSSPDGSTWHLRHTFSTGDIRSVCWTGESFVAVGDSVILVSGDGVNWSGAAVNAVLHDVVTSEDVVVAVGDSGAVYMSSDLSSWTVLNNGLNSYAVAANLAGQYPEEPRFYAGGENFRKVNSSDGITWSTPYDYLADFDICDMALTEHNFVAVGEGGNVVGGSWDSSYDTNYPTRNDLRSAAAGDESWAVVGDNGEVISGRVGYNWWGTSTYIIWTRQHAITSLDLKGVVWNGSGYLAVGDSGIVIVSPPSKD